MSWRILFASSQPPDYLPLELRSRNCADSADIAGDFITPTIGQEGGFADFADFALDIKKDTLSLEEKTPVKSNFEGKLSLPSPGVLLQAYHNSTSTAEYAKSAKPIQPGWLVTYQDRAGRLRGGADERPAGTVTDCDAWHATLVNGDRILLGRIIAVARTHETGAILAVWLISRHGLDGNREAAP